MAIIKQTAMMRIAIAGAGGFTHTLIRELAQTAHALLVLSREKRPDLEKAYDCQVAVVTYDINDLAFALRGVDLVISTVSGDEQINLIDAARRSRVRRFVPAEFEGPLEARPGEDVVDSLDNGSTMALTMLRSWSMPYTVFSCGIFYEQFAPGGVISYNMGAKRLMQLQGYAMIDIGGSRADLPAKNSRGLDVDVVLTSAQDVANFVARVIDDMKLEDWPSEFKIQGERMTTVQLARVCSEVGEACRVPLSSINLFPFSALEEWAHVAPSAVLAEHLRWRFMRYLLQTANGRFSFQNSNPNQIVPVGRMGFREWLLQIWGSTATAQGYTGM